MEYTETMVIQLTYYACMILNMFPKSNSIAGVAPREIFTGIRVDYKRDCKLEFGEYVQVYAEKTSRTQWKPEHSGKSD